MRIAHFTVHTEEKGGGVALLENKMPSQANCPKLDVEIKVWPLGRRPFAFAALCILDFHAQLGRPVGHGTSWMISVRFSSFVFINTFHYLYWMEIKMKPSLS